MEKKTGEVKKKEERKIKEEGGMVEEVKKQGKMKGEK